MQIVVILNNRRTLLQSNEQHSLNLDKKVIDEEIKSSNVRRRFGSTEKMNDI